MEKGLRDNFLTLILLTLWMKAGGGVDFFRLFGAAAAAEP